MSPSNKSTILRRAIRPVQDDIKTGLLYSSGCSGWYEFGCHQVTLVWRDIGIQKIGFIAFFASDIELGNERIFTSRENGDVDMRRTPGVMNRSDGSKAV